MTTLSKETSELLARWFEASRVIPVKVVSVSRAMFDECAILAGRAEPSAAVENGRLYFAQWVSLQGRDKVRVVRKLRGKPIEGYYVTPGPE